MFQSFKTTASPDTGPERLDALQSAMKEASVTHFLVPHADEHQNEYLPKRAERLAWLTGFTGSAGFAIATLENCIVFVDGRYTLQVAEQIHPDRFSSESLVDLPPSQWLEENTSADDTIGFDPWLITPAQFKAYEKAAEKTGAQLKPVENLIDEIWDDQPDAPLGKISLHPVQYAGKESSEKISEIQQSIADRSADLTVLTDPASLAWLFNIRGSDVVHNPIPLGFSIIPASKKPLLFVDSRKLDEATSDELAKLAEICEPDTLTTKLGELSADASVLFDNARSPLALANCIEEAGGKLVTARDPVILPRAIKNETELQGARDAHVRDGVAMCKFLHWLDQQTPANISEIDAAKALERFRSENATAMSSELKEISFDTISGRGPNGAIVHYRVTEQSNRTFESDSLYLCDSGGQYPDGTTDITRTIAIGNPPEKAKTDFTLVLKGHIGIATARFPKGTRGVDIDPLARLPLWQHGKDFAHGTGHGVGSYLNVHEAPQSISKRGTEVLLPGMIISNEPGYYVENEYGIRIENLVIVKEAEALPGGNVETHAFETITLAPIDTRLVEASLLNEAERQWLNAYHRQVFNKLAGHLGDDERAWLENACKPV